jgi:amidohydrolase
MLGAASFGAAAAVKSYLEKTGKDGTVIFFGCPGEEGGASKAFMAREGIWKSLDCALTWHPGSENQTVTGTNNSCTQVLYKFKGVAAHAAGDPENGRSALDAVELMNIGVNYLREHMKRECSVHYAMVDGGGFSPNVVQPHASVLYMVRSVLVKDTLELQERVDRCAEGAALMTGTSFEKIFVDGTANYVPNTTLEKVLLLAKENNMLVQIETKPTDRRPGLEEEVIRLIEKTGMKGRVMIISLFTASIAKVKELDPGITTAHAVMMTWKDYAEVKDADNLSAEVGTVSPELVHDLHEAGMKVFCWTADDPDGIQYLVSCGVDVIGTDDPVMVTKMLDEADYSGGIRRFYHLAVNKIADMER